MREAHLRDFIAVTDLGSVRAAARQLNLSQGAVSRNLMALEKEVGVALLVRSAHGVEPTEFGRVLLRGARLADVELRKALEEIASMAGHGHGTVHLGLSPAAEALVGTQAVRRFREKEPGAVVQLRGGAASTLVWLLREGKLDFAVTSLEAAALGADLQAERLFSSDHVLVTRHGHPLADATQLAQLRDCDWVQGAVPGALEPVVQSAFRKAGLPPPKVAVLRDSFSALVFLLLDSDYVGVSTEAAVAPFCRAGLLTRLRVRSPGASVQSLVTPATRPLSPPAQKLAAEVRRIARALRR